MSKMRVIGFVGLIALLAGYMVGAFPGGLVALGLVVLAFNPRWEPDGRLWQVGSAASNVLGLFQKDPTFNTLRNIKNPVIDQGESSLLSDWKGTTAANNASLSDYISKYLAGTPGAAANAAQETGVMDQFFNGSMSNQLANLRANRLKAINDAADVSASQALRSNDLSKLSRQGGEGSFDVRSAIAALAPIRTGAAVQDADQGRADLGFLTSSQLGLTGQRQALADAISSRSLMPANARTAILNQNIGSLSGLSSLDNSNRIYGVQKHLTDLDKWQNFLQSQQSTDNASMSQVASLAGAAGGGGGGGSSL